MLTPPTNTPPTNQDSNAQSLTERVRTIHGVIASRYPEVDRIALALYDPLTDVLKTFVSSNLDGEALTGYEAHLADVPSLKALASSHQSRLVSNISEAFKTPSAHTEWLKTRTYQTSYTVPVYQGTELAAFLFFDSKQANAFDENSAKFLDLFADLIAQLYLLQLRVARNLAGTVHVASGLARVRDLETGRHLERMASYSRLMATALAGQHGLSDEFIEYVFLFAPLHDIGKVGIPDRVLLKPGKLDAAEWQVMQRHVEIGETLIDEIVKDTGLDNALATRVMRNIVAAHHERGDGSGYPRGLKMAAIPIEARIIAVADVYDALSNVRPYKQAWTEQQIVEELDREITQGRLDADCVAALMSAKDERLAIQTRFADET